MAIRNILRLPAVMRATGLSKAQLYNLMSKGEFPRPMQLSAQAVGWPDTEVEEWQTGRPRATGGWSPRDRKRPGESA
jgi:prophage regulatory protein